MLIFEQSDEFANWFRALRDIKARAKISARLRVEQGGNLGDCQPVGEGVSEMRIHFGPGYRIYFTRTGDIKIAIEMAGALRKERP